MIKILIVDDQLVVREKLQAVFREQCDLWSWELLIP